MKTSRLTLFICLFISTFASCSLIGTRRSEVYTNIKSSESPILWELYPNPNEVPVYAGEEITFKLTPQPGKRIDNITINFGDGKTKKLENPECKEIDGKTICTSVYEPHQYFDEFKKTDCKEINEKVICTSVYESEEDRQRDSNKKAYKLCKPFIQYFDEGRLYESRIKFVILSSEISSDEEIKEKAIENMVKKLREGIRDVIKLHKDRKNLSILGIKDGELPKFALSSLRNANFEYPDNKIEETELNVIQKITQYLVEKNLQEPSYAILEKNSQVLTRLAYEAVIDPNPKPTEESKSRKIYLGALEYGLMSDHKGPSNPIVYSIKMETDAERFIIESTSSYGDDGKSEKNVKKQEASKEASGSASETKELNAKKEITVSGSNQDSSNKNIKQMKSVSSSRLLAARFDTAHFLIVIDQLYKASIIKTEPIYYNLDCESKMIKRTAKIKINTRILSREGIIEWIKDIDSNVEDKVIPQFLIYAQKMSPDNEGELKRSPKREPVSDKLKPENSDDKYKKIETIFKNFKLNDEHPKAKSPENSSSNRSDGKNNEGKDETLKGGDKTKSESPENLPSKRSDDKDNKGKDGSDGGMKSESTETSSSKLSDDKDNKAENFVEKPPESLFEKIRNFFKSLKSLF